MIPLILHQTWKTAALSKREKAWFDSFDRFNPGLDHRFYDDADCRTFVANRFPDLLQIYDRLPLPILRVDFFRYLVVYAEGGIYADVDMECRRPLASLLTGYDALFCVEARLTRRRQAELGYSAPLQIANCIFAAPREHPFLRAVIERVCLNASNATTNVADVEDLTGPRMLTRLFYERPFHGIRVLRQSYFLPSRLYPDIYPFNSRVHTRHHFSGSWKAGNSKISLIRKWIERDIPPNPVPRSPYQRFEMIAERTADLGS